MFAAIIAAAVLEGPFPLLVTPFNEKAEVDVPVLVKEAEYVNARGVGGIIWPTAGEVELSDSTGCYLKGARALAEAAAKGGFAARITITVPGRTSDESIARAKAVSAIAAETGAKMALLARPPDDCTNQVLMAAHYRALGRAATVPVILQTYNPRHGKLQPDVSMIVEVAKACPETMGWVKEESPGRMVNARMEELLSHPEIHGVFSGWGAKGWIYQGARIGTCGVITQRPAYAGLLEKVWRRLKAGADGADPELADAYAKYLYMTNLGDVFSAQGDDAMRGPHLYVLQKLGIFRNRLSRTGRGKVEEYQLDAKQQAEIDARFRYVFSR